MRSRKKILVTMVMYWKLLTIVTNTFIRDDDRNPGFISALPLFLWIIQFVTKCLSFFSLMKVMNFTLKTKLTYYFFHIIVESKFNFLLSRWSPFVGTFCRSIWVYWRQYKKENISSSHGLQLRWEGKTLLYYNFKHKR